MEPVVLVQPAGRARAGDMPSEELKRGGNARGCLGVPSGEMKGLGSLLRGWGCAALAASAKNKPQILFLCPCPLGFRWNQPLVSLSPVQSHPAQA